jgi:hypothetical protein
MPDTLLAYIKRILSYAGPIPNKMLAGSRPIKQLLSQQEINVRIFLAYA